MKVFFIGNFLPRKCGIATFTYDLTSALSLYSDIEYKVVAMNNNHQGYNYPKEVVFEIQQDELEEYEKAAEFINLSDADIICLQHEFGIFGGSEGVFIYHLMEKLNKPIVTTLHTIIEKNSIIHKKYAKVLSKVLNLSSNVICISNKGKEILINDYNIPESKISVIHHGVPDVPFIDPSYYKSKFNAEDNIVLLTFGLLSPGKGIETILEALPKIIDKYPKILYFIVGATHPEIKSRSGESYRIKLELKTRQLGIEDNVIFYNQFVSEIKLKQFIGACDIFITPYPNKKQISSGTLAMAVGSGKAVISTPYWHAEELLANDRGVLTDFNNSEAMYNTILSILEDPVKRNYIRKRAYDYGRNMIWSVVSKEYIHVFEDAVSHYVPEKEAFIKKYTFPSASAALNSLLLLTDSTSIIRSSTCAIPNRKEGYFTDDAARGIIAILQYFEMHSGKIEVDLIRTYLTHIYHSQTEEGEFRSILSYSRQWKNENNTNDTQGRVLWALGKLMSSSSKNSYQITQQLVTRMIEKLLPKITLINEIRPISYSISGIYEILKTYSGATIYHRLIKQLADKLVQSYEKNSSPTWHWFEPIMTYGNAKIPEALFLAYKVNKEPKYLHIAKESLDFLIKILNQEKNKFFDLIGTNGWYEQNGKRAIFAQKPIDATYLVTACITAYKVTKDEKYSKYAERAFEWFLGRNRLEKSLYDFKSGSCSDGIDEHGVSYNKSAESIIYFFLALLAMKKHYALKEE